MREELIKQEIEHHYPGSRVTVPRKQRIIVTLAKDSLFSLLGFMKEKGFQHLSLITCVDWIEENEFELVYHLANYQDGNHAIIKVRIGRSDPSFLSVTPLFENAQTYEREIHEMFGVEFIGNARLTPFLLTNWREIPPMRKDFDTKEYAERMFEHE